MYHYVRDMHKTDFPGIKGLLIDDFIGQIEYLEKYYTFVTVEECIDALKPGSKTILPKNAVLLTFDDAYIDHYQNVFPVLQKYGIQGVFFAPIETIINHKVLDVNKIHFVLASVPVNVLLEELKSMLTEYKAEYHLQEYEYYFDKLAKSNHLDPKEVIFIKRLLQHELDIDIRTLIADKLFKKYVSSNESEFAKKLYMNIEQMQIMADAGMVFGSHGTRHVWLDKLSLEEQQEEIATSFSFLKNNGLITDDWLMCYPYGASNSSLHSVLKDYNCKLAFTTNVGLSRMTEDNALLLERLDTVHLPVNKHTKPNLWTEKVIC